MLIFGCVACSPAKQPPGATPPATVPPSVPPSVPTPSRTPAPSVSPATQSARVGSRLTLLRTRSETVDVNVLEVADPARGARTPPPAGRRWVAVHLEISNPASPTYAERPRDGLRLLDRAGTLYAPAPGDPVRPPLASPITVRRGSFARGYLTFAVPTGARIASVRFTPGAATGPDTGAWTIP